MRYLSDDDLRNLGTAETAALGSPVPTQMISNGEFTPIPQTRAQERVEREIEALVEELAPRHGMSRRQFLASSAGMSAAFVAMNTVFGPIFNASRAEAATPGRADERARALAGQFIFDCQTHFVRDDYGQQGITGLAQFAKQFWNPALANEKSLDRMKFANYVKEIFVDSDTKVALLSGSPVDDPFNLFLNNDQIVAARSAVNSIAGSRRMLAHSIIQPMSDGWLDEVDRCIETLRPDSWKGYTIGDPIFLTKKGSNWRLDDEKRLYPFYEKCVKSGITTVCIHKGLLPADYEKSWPEIWKHATVWDLGKAAKDWPQITFIIYHSAMRPFLELPEATLAQFDQTGRIDWVTDLAEIPQKFGVKNVRAELGTCFANTCVTHPRLAAAMIGTLIKGLGQEKVIWGTDSVWYGSPQWQIEALRRLEIPEDMRKKHGFAPLGAADGPVKNAIFADNAARHYKLDTKKAAAAIKADELTAMREHWAGDPSNLRYGYTA
jgi:predicted TIM-barrel fold metal-dependent hydrolase